MTLSQQMMQKDLAYSHAGCVIWLLSSGLHSVSIKQQIVLTQAVLFWEVLRRMSYRFLVWQCKPEARFIVRFDWSTASCEWEMVEIELCVARSSYVYFFYAQSYPDKKKTPMRSGRFRNFKLLFISLFLLQENIKICVLWMCCSRAWSNENVFIVMLQWKNVGFNSLEVPEHPKMINNIFVLYGM